MGWYKSNEWETCLTTFDEWWAEATEYLNSDGSPSLPGIRGTIDLVDLLIDIANLDPMPVWDIDRWVRNRHQHLIRMQRDTPHDGYREPVSLAEIDDRLQQAQMLRVRCERAGVVNEEPSGRSARRRSHNEARDKFIYNERMKESPIPYSKILKKIRTNSGWSILDSDQAARQAADRYADRKGIPRVPKET